MNQGSAEMVELPIEITLDIVSKLVKYPSAESIQVLGEYGLGKIVTLTRPTPNMSSHVRSLYVWATLDGIPMAKILVDL